MRLDLITSARQNPLPVGGFWKYLASEVIVRASGLVLLALAASCSFARADNWQASIYEKGAPSHIVGVDKKRQLFNFFEKKSPIRLRYSYPCVTGQLAGDKQQINDLRTPEGVYFVEYRIANGLDFREYGGIAYTLNYPNPVDRLRGKTGHGIWIHSKGFELAPTRGCVAINLKNIEEVGPLLTPGTAVVLAEELKEPQNGDNETVSSLCSLMAQWSQAWAARSDKMFEFYNPAAYSLATENFDAFRKNKERLFKILSFIKIYNREIHALEGPGYWVTWTEQFYTASNLSTEGIRRLYWQKDKSGSFKIVGMEWTPRDVGMRAAFNKGMLVAEGPVTLASDASSEAPVAPRLDMPEQAPQAPEVFMREPMAPLTNSYSPLGKIGARIGESISSLAENLLAISEPLVPRKQLKPDNPDEIIWGEGRRITDIHEPVSSTTPVRQETQEQAPPAHGTIVSPKSVPVETKAPASAETQSGQLELDASTIGKLSSIIDGWVDRYQSRNPEISGYYNKKLYNRLPSSAGVPKGRSYTAEIRDIERQFRQPWLVVIKRSPKFAVKGDVVHAQLPQLVVWPDGMRQGYQNFWLQKDNEGEFLIIASQFVPQPLGLEANYLEQVSSDVTAMIEGWRKAWEAADVNGYMEFYTPDAWQQGRKGIQNIRRQKEELWKKAKPVHVQLTGVRIAPDGGAIRADMRQSYENSMGHGDKGVKTLLLRYDGHTWRIQREDWTKQDLQDSADR